MPGTILIVEDEQSERFLIQAILEGQGYVLEMACSSPEALEKADQLLPDLILLDVMMPDMDGFEICSRIRGNPRVAKVPVIMLTTLDERKDMLKGLESGADDYITKPYDCRELRARIATITHLKRYRKLMKKHAEIEAAHANRMTVLMESSADEGGQ